VTADQDRLSVRFWAVVPAAGRGSRMAEAMPKQYLPLAGVSVLHRALAPLEAEPRIAGIVLVVAPDDPFGNDYRPQTSKPLIVAHGGAQRCDSVGNGLRALEGEADEQDWVIVHDAARPCLHRDDLTGLIDTLCSHPCGGLLAAPVHDTLKRASSGGAVLETVDRAGLWRALTPQMFRYGLLRDALAMTKAAGRDVTDEAAAMELAGHAVQLVEGRPDNIKVTRSADLEQAEHIIAALGQ